MRRVCIINVAALSQRLLSAAGDLPSLSGLACPPRPMRMMLPAVTCSVQASLTTGVLPETHGIVANGLYFRQCRKVSFWEQSNTLLSKKRFWHSRHLPRTPKVAMLFWQNSMAGAADIVVTPKPRHTPDGKTVSWCFSQPTELYEQLVADLGEFDLKTYWGPLASIESSRWITACAIDIWKRNKPDLQLVYLPHLDYAAQKLGPDHPQLADEVRAVDELIGRIIAAVRADGGETIIVSEYGIVPVSRAVLPNIRLREAGLLEIQEKDGRQLIDYDYSRAFAMVDHQIAHIFCNDADAIPAARDVIASLPGVATVLAGEQISQAGLKHFRTGELVALAEPDAWFAYYWWTDPAAAPPFARAVDIHRKPGYDPCELFFDPSVNGIPVDPSLVKGSHGLADVAPRDQAILAATCAIDAPEQPSVTDFPGIVKTVMYG